MTEIKSQDDLNAQGREADVLIATIMKCQELVKEKVELENENKDLKEQLAEHKEYCCCHKNEILLLENARLKELMKECKTRMTDCLYKLYDEGGQSYPNLEEELKPLLTKIDEALK